MNFMTIATPHLGVQDHTWLEDELGLYIPTFLKTLVSATMSVTGRDLFATILQTVINGNNIDYNDGNSKCSSDGDIVASNTKTILYRDISKEVEGAEVRINYSISRSLSYLTSLLPSPLTRIRLAQLPTYLPEQLPYTIRSSGLFIFLPEEKTIQ